MNPPSKDAPHRPSGIGRRSAMSAVAIVFASHRAFAQKDGLGLIQLGAAINSAVERATLHDAPEKASLLAMATDRDKLDRYLRNAKPGIPGDYEQSLLDLTRAVSTLSWANAPNPQNASIVESVRRDLSRKVQYMEAGNGAFGFTRGLLVSVTVMTTRRDKPESGYRVGFNSYVDKDAAAFRYPFSSVTNHATRLLPPGIYWMSIYKDGYRRMETVEIGEKNSDEQVIRFEL